MWSEPPPAMHAGREQALQRLEIAQAVVAELGRQCARVELQPGRLDVDDDAQPGRLLDRLATHEVGMRDARPRRRDRRLLVHFFVGFEQRLHRPVADAMGRELQAGFDGRAHHRHQLSRAG